MSSTDISYCVRILGKIHVWLLIELLIKILVSFLAMKLTLGLSNCTDSVRHDVFLARDRQLN